MGYRPPIYTMHPSKKLLSIFARLTLYIGIAITAIHIAHAQPAPLPDRGASEILLQQQRERELREHMESTPNVRLEGLAQEESLPQNILLPVDEQPCFTINHIELTGELAHKFQWAITAANQDGAGQADRPQGRCLGTEGINIVMGRIQNKIIEKGFITTRVVAAPQDLTTGTLTLTVIPGYIQSIRFKEGSEQRTNWRTALPMREGDLLNLRDLEQALEAFKRVPTAEADIEIEPGQEVGQSDLVLSWKQKFPFRLNLSVDDGGSRSTGRYQGAMTISYDNWFTLNDLFYLSINKGIANKQGGGSQGYSLHYSVPIQGNWLLSFNGSTYDYDQEVAGINQNYTYSGDSQNLDVTLSRRLYRDISKRINVYAKGWTRRSHNFIDGTEIQVQRRQTTGWEIGTDYRQYLGRSILNASLSFKRGTGAYGALRAPEEAYGGGTSRMKIINLNTTLNIPFQMGEQRLYYLGTLRAQWNDTALIPQDQFAIGGRYTVRGFDGRTSLMGDRGWFIRNDIGWALGKTGHEIYAGLDYGRVSGPATRYQLGQNLKGAVIGLRGGMNGGKYAYLSYDAFVGTWLHKPDGFITSKYTSGFSVNVSF